MAEKRARPVAMVTGGGTGVGAACALKFAERGHDIVVNYSRSRAEAEDVAARAAAAGAEALALQGDVAEDRACRSMIETTIDRFGRLDVLVNSAGATQFAPIAELDRQNAEDFQRVYAVNVVGPYQMVRAAAPHLAGSPRGAVVNVSSIAGVTGNGSSIAYVASKGALNTLTLTLARLLAPQIRVNAVLPGLIDTRWLPAGLGEDTYADVKANFMSAAALGDVCTADDIADAVVFLALDAAKMTGQLVNVDAGFMLGRGVRISR